MTWLKYDDGPIVLDDLHHRWQREPRSQYDKPRGFWITDDSEQCWRSWCLSEEFDLDTLTHVHEVELDESRILFLRSTGELDDFTREYAGIIITPYQWARRLELSWYYNWDCASGCIWDVSAILGVHLREIVPIPAARSCDDEQEEAA